jgi:hypothetical protein
MYFIDTPQRPTQSQCACDDDPSTELRLAALERSVVALIMQEQSGDDPADQIIDDAADPSQRQETAHMQQANEKARKSGIWGAPAKDGEEANPPPDDGRNAPSAKPFQTKPTGSINAMGSTTQRTLKMATGGTTTTDMHYRQLNVQTNRVIDAINRKNAALRGR